MNIFTLAIISDFKNDGIQFSVDPSYCTILFRVIGSAVLIIRIRPNFFGLLKTDPTFWVVPEYLALILVEFKSHDKMV